ncbi:beta-glucoside PTS system IIABC component [Mesoplasma florum L1]|uniref:Beta-glucoside PTS system IIABC component n=1 Tax=Mesoplasma florum (strain ATCC 33453 / NBRC 100688 / NCTC 11704 / L1) TaxID=265311 RepID=Q6F2B1_MESFL|nr:glucose PTS transporter subunit IIA [Mesoplasma florum]AAT75364.1 beta-glucoside PTS system IIABC component [Mesoplasma florum L1]ATI73655.1 hypothetical protein CQZ70_00045 [Mesoplasma florum]
MEIKIYAPVDCEVLTIDKCSDKAFSQKLLGDGLLIKPKKGNFTLPFDEAKTIMVFDTKHAYGFDISGVGILIHCGLETVNLNGEPFSTSLQPNQTVKKGEKIFDVDLKILKNKNISSETPIVFDKNVKIKNLREGSYKQGELICNIEFLNENKDQEIKIDSLEDFFNVKNKYQKIAFDINKCVGNKENYKNVYNCMTRLRFQIKNKELVNEEELQKISLVKQLVWNGAELQVIIGQEVYKVKDEVVAQNEFVESVVKDANKEKKSIIGKFMQLIGGTLIRQIPVMTGCGIIQALMALLVIGGIMPSIVTSGTPGEGQISLFDPNLNAGWVALFIIARSATYFAGIVVAYSASEYFGLNPILGITIGIILSSPLIFLYGGPNGIGEEKLWINLGELNTNNIPFNNITRIFKIAPLGTKVFVIMPVIWIASKINTWVLKWMPTALDLMFRPFILFLVCSLVGFFLFAPVWYTFEALFGALMYYVTSAPLGIGVGIYVGMWQLCVIFGLHGPLGIAAQVEYLSNGGWSYLAIGGSVSVWAQVGALIGVAIITRDSVLKNQAWGMVPMGLLGITEPILYGINLPKKRPLIAGIMAAFIAGAFMNWMGVSMRAQTGIGVFEAIGFFADPTMGGTATLGGLQNGLFYIFGCLLSVGSAIGITMLIYKERFEEKSLVAKTTRKMFKYVVKEKDFEKELAKNLKENLNEISQTYTKEENKFIKEQEKNIQQYLKLVAKINEKNIQNDEKIEKCYKEGKKAIKSNNNSKALLMKEKIDSLSKLDLSDLEREKNELKSKIDFNGINEIKNQKLKLINAIVDKVEKENNVDLSKYKNEYSKDVDSLLLNYAL